MAKEEAGKASGPPGRADALRAAVDQAFGVTAVQARDAAGRVRDLLPPTGDELRALQARVDELEARVAALERPKAT